MRESKMISAAPLFRQNAPRTLILIPCSQRKRRAPRSPIAAIERYDGPLYKVLRKALREGRVSSETDVAILSAKYGLLNATTPIPFYDQKMDAVRAIVLAPQVRAELRQLIAAERYARIRVNLGRDYAALLDGVSEMNGAEWASGAIGLRAATLKAWLSDGVAQCPALAGKRLVTNGK
jgi:hypothetical protein